MTITLIHPSIKIHEIKGKMMPNFSKRKENDGKGQMETGLILFWGVRGRRGGYKSIKLLKYLI